MDPWARSADTADSSLAAAVEKMLLPGEVQEIMKLCGRCLLHTITTAVALRVSPRLCQLACVLAQLHGS